VLTLAVVLAVSSCRKQGPSAEYAEAERKFSRLYSEKLEEAYADPQLSEIEALLTKVHPDSPDHPKAAALQAKITQGKADLQAELQRRDQAATAESAAPAWTGSSDTFEPPPTDAARSPPDAGSTTAAWAGMTVAEMRKNIGACLTAGEPIEVAGQPGPKATFEIADTSACKTKFPGQDAFLFVVDGDKVLGLARKANVERVPVDGGS
jgi:hypothetical protein